MFNTSNLFLIYLLIILFFLGCDTLSFNKKIITAEGKRLDILDYKEELSVNSQAADIAVVLGKLEKNNSWNQSGKTSTHSPGNLYLNKNPKLVWKARVGDGDNSYNKLFAQLVSENELIFSLDSEGTIFSLNINTGKKLWKKTIIPSEESINSNIDGGLAISDGILIAATSYGEVIALKSEDGSILWKNYIGRPVQGAPTISENMIFQMTVNNDLIVIDLQTGKELWRYAGPYESAILNGASASAVEGNIVIFPSNTGELYAFNKNMGTLIWQTELSLHGGISTTKNLNDIDSGPVIDDNLIFAGTYEGRFGAVDYLTGLVIWDVPLKTTQNPVINGNSIFVLTEESILVSMLRDNGNVRWISDLNFKETIDKGIIDNISSIFSKTKTIKSNCKGPLLAGNNLWLGCGDKSILVINPDDGKILRSFNLPSPNAVTPIVVSGMIFFYTNDARIFAYR